jgi:beta-lactamase superfamily II metal-dependent hydrolase
MSKWRAGALTLTVLAGAVLALPAPSGAQAGRPLDLFFVDTEGGAATLMVMPSGESILVDSGWPREDGRDAKRIEHVARYVAGVRQIDHYVTTHWHTDHYGGIEYLSKLMPVRHYWDHGIPSAAEDGAQDFNLLMSAYKRANGGKSKQLKPGDTLALRRAGAPIELKVVASEGKVIGEGSEAVPTSCKRHIPAPVADDSDNKRSVSLLLSVGKFGFLNCGDLTWDIEHKLACPKNRVGQVDLWQVTHHGWEASGNPALVEAMQPKVAMMVNGARKGASPRTIKTLKSAPSIEAFYQLHRSVVNRPEENTTPERIANMEENCKGEFMRVQLAPAGDRYTVFKGASQPLQTFQVK